MAVQHGHRRAWRAGWVFFLAGGMPLLAQAHIKWFHAYDLMQPPRDMDMVLTMTPFAGMFMLALGAIFMAALAEQHLCVNQVLVQRWMGRANQVTERHAYVFLRVMTALLFMILAQDGRTLLTPELAASSPCVAEIQWVIALTALFPATGAIAGAGILMLYGMAIEKFGLFHMLDYPAFIGAAIYLMWMAADRSAHVKALAVLRAATALTLMVGATEKFGYPQWSFDLLRNYPVLTFGIQDLEFYMVGAGLVEFALAYLVLFGRLSGGAGAGLLFMLMASAILLFGWMDAVGHALFLAALLVLMFSRNPVAEELERRLSEQLGRWDAAPSLRSDRVSAQQHAHNAGAGGTARNGQSWRGLLIRGVLSAALFGLLVVGFVQSYRAANLALTMCSTAADGSHLHR